MGPMMLLYNDLVAAAAKAGGDWQTGADVALANIGNRDYSKVARSVDATAAKTQFTLDHGSALSRRALILDGTNLSSAAQVRWSVGTTLGGSEVYAGSLVNAWQFTPRTYSGRDHQVWIILPTAATGRYDKVELVDTTNADGYVEVARAFVASLSMQPTYNARYGLRDTVIDLSDKDRARGGALWLDQQRKLRGTSFVLEGLSLDEGNTLHELMRTEGITGEIVYAPNYYDAAWLQRFGFVGTLEELSDLEYPFDRRRTLPLRAVQAC